MNQVKANGASTTLFQHDRPNKPNRSKFDLSRFVNFSADPGMIIPIDCIPTLPGDDFNLNLKMAVDTLPLVQTSLTQYKIVTHWYYLKNRDLWKGWKTFVTKGRTGNINLTVPQVDLNYPLDKPKGGSETISIDSVNHTAYGYHYPISHHSLSSFLGVPPYRSGLYNIASDSAVLVKDYLPYSFQITNKNDLSDAQMNAYNEATLQGFGNYNKVNALPFVAYQNIVKNNYVNQNLLQDNTALFPIQGDDDWLLPYTIENNVANYISGRSEITTDDKINIDGVYSSDETDVDLRLLRYACFDDDYFTTGLPWLQRGDVTSLPVDTDIEDAFTLEPSYLSSGGQNFTDSFVTLDDNGTLYPNNVYVQRATDYNQNDFAEANTFIKMEPNDNLPTSAVSRLRVRILSGQLYDMLKLKYNGAKAQVKFTANQFRELIAMSVWQERNARTDGDYNSTIYQHWLKNPRSETNKPVYIGGTVDYLNFSTVIQNSQSTDDSHLGDTAGFGSTAGNGSIGSFHCDDYGFIIGVMIIKPNTTYTQGVEHFLFDTTFEDYPQPEFEGLSPQPILNKELYVQGNADDDDLFCYQERYTYLKVRQNVNRGLFQVKPDKDLLFGAFTQSRWFANKPTLSYQFLCMSPNNIRRDWLAYPVYPTFRIQLLSSVFATRNLAYTSQPNTFGF